MKVQPVALADAGATKVKEGMNENGDEVSKGGVEANETTESKLKESMKQNEILREECQKLRNKMWELHQKLRSKSVAEGEKTSVKSKDKELSSNQSKAAAGSEGESTPGRWVWLGVHACAMPYNHAASSLGTRKTPLLLVPCPSPPFSSFPHHCNSTFRRRLSKSARRPPLKSAGRGQDQDNGRTSSHKSQPFRMAILEMENEREKRKSVRRKSILFGTGGLVSRGSVDKRELRAVENFFNGREQFAKILAK